MGVIRKEKKESYTNIDNGIFKDASLSAKAKGVLCQMLSLPDGWNYSIAGLATLFSDGESSIRSALKELEEAGYFRREQVRENGKIARIEYVVSEEKHREKLVVENPQQENLKQENLKQENSPQYNTKELNTKELSNNGLNTYDDIKSEPKKKPFQKPTIPQIHAYIIQNNLNVDAERFYYYYESNGWVVGKTKMVNWKACVHTWNRKASKPKRDPVDEYMDAVIRGEVI